MEILNQYNFLEFMKFIPTIKKNSKEWRIIEVSLSGETSHNIFFIAKRLQLYFLDGNIEGKIFICNSRETLILAHTGERSTPQKVKKDLIIYLPEYSCEVNAAEASVHEIETIQLKIKANSENPAFQAKHDIRMDRSENIIMIADDDMFMRSLVNKSMKAYGKVIPVEKGNEVVDVYLEHMPDILFLDIHLPGESGIGILDEIQSFDHNAYIIMLSADSNKGNVLTTSMRGAKGFITKPFTEDKLIEMLKKCPTIKNLPVKK